MAKTKQQTKLCKKCNTTKPVEKFGFSKRGIQSWCSQCRGTQSNQLTKKADKEGVIYSITNPLGETYIGQTNMTPKYRWMFHRSNYKAKPGTSPLLHESFDQWGVDAHIFSVVASCGNVNKSELREIESFMIKAYKVNNKSLNIKE